MPRHRQYGYEDDQPLQDGDDGFIGVNMLLDPSQLPNGYVAEAINKRFNSRNAEDRLGIKKLPWTNKLSSPPATIVPFGTVYGAGIFGDPNGVEWDIIAADGKVYRSLECNASEELPLPAGVTITARVSFTQCFNVMVLFRGPDLDPLVMTSLDEGFKVIEQTPAGDGTEVIPRASNGIFVQNRLFIPHGRDLVAASDLLDYTRYAPTLADFRINQGSEDTLVALFKFNETTIVCFKEKSVYAVSQVYGSLSSIRLDELTRAYGLRAARAIVQVGTDVWFLADRHGVVSLTQTEQNKIQGVDVPMSREIDPLIKRIHWAHAANAVAAYWENHYYLAVPLDSAQVVKENIVPAAATVEDDDARFYLTGLVPGRTYRFTPVGPDDSLWNNGTVYLNPIDFVAATDTVYLLSSDPTVLATVQPVFNGVNNAVLVYNFLNKAWSGYDLSDALQVAEFRIRSYAGRKRLFFFGADGFLNLYEEGFVDEILNCSWLNTAQSYTKTCPLGESVTKIRMANTVGSVISQADANAKALAMARAAAEAALSCSSPPPTLATVTFNPPNGALVATFPALMSLLHVTPGVTIRYTTDGSAPSAGSAIYAGIPLVVPDDVMVVKAYASLGGYADSAVSSAQLVASSVVSDFKFLCANADYVGPWDVWTPNGKPDYRYQETHTYGAPKTITNKMVFQTDADGNWTTGQAYSIIKTIQPGAWINWPGHTAVETFDCYPLKVFVDGVAKNTAYGALSAIAAGVHTLDLYGQPFTWPGGYFVSITQFSDGSVHRAAAQAVCVNPVVYDPGMECCVDDPACAYAFLDATVLTWRISSPIACKFRFEFEPTAVITVDGVPVGFTNPIGLSVVDVDVTAGTHVVTASEPGIFFNGAFFFKVVGLSCSNLLVEVI